MHKTIVCSKEFDRTAAQMVMRQILENPASTLCLATGNTTAGIFFWMIQLQKSLQIDCTRIRCVNMDEYVGVKKDDPASCYFRVVQDLYGPLGLRENQFYVPVATEQSAQEEKHRFVQKLNEYGGIDLMLLSVGENGHIAFNEPGSPFGEHIRTVSLSESTIRAKSELFGGDQRVPRQGLTLGIADVMSARRILLVAKGKHKAKIMQRALEGPVSEQVPASVLQLHPALDVLLDEEAVG